MLIELNKNYKIVQTNNLGDHVEDYANGFQVLDMLHPDWIEKGEGEFIAPCKDESDVEWKIVITETDVVVPVKDRDIRLHEFRTT
jgi:hypothetical protein